MAALLHFVLMKPHYELSLGLRVIVMSSTYRKCHPEDNDRDGTGNLNLYFNAEHCGSASGLSDW